MPLDWREFSGCWQGKALGIKKGAEFTEWLNEVPKEFRSEAKRCRNVYIKNQWLYKARKIVSEHDFRQFLEKAPPKYRDEMRNQREK